MYTTTAMYIAAAGHSVCMALTILKLVPDAYLLLLVCELLSFAKSVQCQEVTAFLLALRDNIH